MKQTHSLHTNGRQCATLGEIVIASYEFQARARGALTLRILIAVGRAGARVFRQRSRLEPEP